MSVQPRIQTDRLLLRPFLFADAPEVQRLAGDRAIAETTLLIPHPYEDGVAERWIATHASGFADGKLAAFAVTLADEGQLVGATGLTIEPEHARAEMGYWIGKPYWNRGYCTESAAALIRYGFEFLGLNRVFANWMTSNPASGRVMEKIGMRREGRFAQHLCKWGRFRDVEYYGIVREQFTPAPGVFRVLHG
jgi:RimJ/RimL family protein N-acetyltransferase